MSLSLTQFEVLSFDCYGTLIDWETGIANALRPLLARSPLELTRDRIFEDYARCESRQQAATPAMPYARLLVEVYRALAKTWHADATADLHEAFANSVGIWPAFPDSRPALMYLKKYFKLVVLSNVDHRSFAGSAKQLGVEFDAVYTAEDIGSYKPAAENFTYLIKHVEADFGVGKSRILHVAQSLFHDHVPARKFGLSNAWIDRRHDADGWGATMPPAEIPHCDYSFHSMADLVKAHQQMLRSAH